MKQVKKVDFAREVENKAKEIYKKLGGGFSAEIYKNALKYELIKAKYDYVEGQKVDIFYGPHILGEEPIDLIVMNELIVQVKSYATTSKVALSNFRAYVRMSKYRKGILIVFPTPYSEEGISIEHEPER